MFDAKRHGKERASMLQHPFKASAAWSEHYICSYLSNLSKLIIQSIIMDILTLAVFQIIIISWSHPVKRKKGFSRIICFFLKLVLSLSTCKTVAATVTIRDTGVVSLDRTNTTACCVVLFSLFVCYGVNVQLRERCRLRLIVFMALKMSTVS